MRSSGIAGLCFTALALWGCASLEQHTLNRTQALRNIYPAEATTRADVVERFKPSEPRFSELRPAAGWLAPGPFGLHKRALSVEEQTGKQVARVDVYHAVDGFFSLCYCLFFYDQAGRVVDAQWQYASD